MASVLARRTSATDSEMPSTKLCSQIIATVDDIWAKQILVRGSVLLRESEKNRGLSRQVARASKTTKKLV